MSDQRYPVIIRLIGVMHKTKSKMFMTSVLWSDDSDIIVYRSFQDFKKLHKQLKKRFPTERTIGKSERMIPKFRAVTVQKKKKGPSKSMVRLNFLEKYFSQLLKCEPRVTQCTEISQFFHPTPQDLQPDIGKDSIVVMPSEDLRDGGDHPGNGVGNVSQPFVTETYRCVAPYETKDTKNRPFKVALNETVDVLIKDKAGWWLVENENKCMAWFPAPYLEKCEGEDEEGEEDERSVTPEEGMLYHAVKNFKATKADEASVSIGTVVEVLQKSDNGWWLIRCKGKVGYVPSMYLRPYSNPVRFAAMQNQRRGSNLNQALQVPGAAAPLSSHGRKLSRSHGNLLSPGDYQPGGMRESLSLEQLADPHPRPHSTQPPRLRDSLSLERLADPHPRPHSAQPTIRVEPPEEQQQEGRLGDRQSSLSSEWSSEGSSELSFSDDSSAPDVHSVSLPVSSWQARRPLTPQLAVAPDDRLTSSRSDPDLFKSASTPKVPPRPHAQEILSRCTTITRRAAQSPSRTRIPLSLIPQSR
ncbi:NADPH oxidase organizer 1-like [Conger conger]|uniref:NADPH oxidase organizer 1-like n=1 Tax=Conger conger TaxID=82655 RepID=UPI002A59F725|nr:NADPH oxidase organizer 1-like [Conger conger]